MSPTIVTRYHRYLLGPNIYKLRPNSNYCAMDQGLQEDLEVLTTISNVASIFTQASGLPKSSLDLWRRNCISQISKQGEQLDRFSRVIIMLIWMWLQILQVHLYDALRTSHFYILQRPPPIGTEHSEPRFAVSSFTCSVGEIHGHDNLFTAI